MKHGTTTGYRKGCRCDECRLATNRARRDRYARSTSPWAAGRLRREEYLRRHVEAAKRAKMLLEDGASYAEAAVTAGVDPQWLKLQYPGYEENAREWNSVRQSIMHSETLAKLHREIWQGARY